MLGSRSIVPGLTRPYSMIDCMSMAICRRLQIAEILTGDRDFEREGFMILM